MNIKKQNLRLLILFLVIGCLTIITVVAKYKDKNQDVELLAKPLESSYILGEVVEFQVTVKNNSSDRMLHRGLSLASNSLILQIASDDGVYRKHNYYRSKDVRGFIKAGDSINSIESVLWNSVPNYVDKRYLPKNIILSDYVFPKAGVYYLKFQLILPDDNGSSRMVESDPITLVIN